MPAMEERHDCPARGCWYSCEGFFPCEAGGCVLGCEGMRVRLPVTGMETADLAFGAYLAMLDAERRGR